MTVRGRIFLRLACAGFVFLLALTTSHAARVTGKVYHPSRESPLSVDLTIIDLRSKEQRRILTDQRGRFQVELPAGDYAIYHSPLGVRVLLASLSVEENDNLDLELVLSPFLNGRYTAEENMGARAKEEAVSRTSAAQPEDASLQRIRELRVQIGFEEARQRQTLAEIVNPFPAQKRTRWYGTLYEFHRNDNFDARNFFDPVGRPLPEYKRNQFGVSFGTALGESLNILTSYEGLRIIQGSTLLSHVPTPEMKRGDFSGLDEPLMDPATGIPLPGNGIPPHRIHPVAGRLLDLIPDPNREDADRNFVNNQPIVRNNDSLSFQLDHQLDPSSKVFVRYSFMDGNHVLVHPLPNFGWDRQLRDQAVALSYTRNFTPRWITSGQFRFDRYSSAMLSKNAGSAGLLQSLGIAGLPAIDPSEEGYPEFRLAGYASFGDGSSPRTSIYNDFSLEGSASYVVGDHTVRFGLEFEASQVNNYRSGHRRRGQFTFNGYYSGDAFADFLFGIPDTVYRVVGSDRSDLRAQSWQFFLRDEWKISPQFNFSFGVIYNYFAPYQSVHQNVSTFYPLLFEPPVDGEIVIAGNRQAEALGLGEAGSRGLVFPDRSDWAPRLGFEYSPFGNRSLVFDSTYSIFYYRPNRRDFMRYLGRNYPFYYTQSARAPIDSPDLNLTAPFEATAPTELRIRTIEPRLRTPYLQYWRLSAQSEIHRNWMLEVSYQGSKLTHLQRELVANVPLPGPGQLQPRRPNPNFAAFEILTGSGSSTRHSLRLSLDRRLTDGLAIKSDFSWNRAFSDDFGGSPSNPRNLRAERAPPSYLPTRSFSMSYIYDLPFGNEESESRGLWDWFMAGWRLSGITSIQDGDFFSVSMPGDPNNDGVSGDRPQRLGSGHLEPGLKSIDRWFATEDFAIPPPYSFGNSGRNVLSGPGFHDWDLSLIKQTRFAGGDVVELRIEFFNAFNQVNFEEPNALLATSLFGKIFGAQRAREIEIALKYSF